MRFPISIAPMMDWTDRHERYFLRLISQDVILYTEMITAQAVCYGNHEKLLAYDPSEHPLVLQLGGCDLNLLAEASMIGESYGYGAINLNVGCPSPRVSAGHFGVSLMLEAEHVAHCIFAIKKKVNIPVTIKCRIGVNEFDSYDFLYQFVTLTHQAGCDNYIIHARKAWLNGLSPKENRNIPPLCYDRVKQLKNDFPHLNIIVNGGIETITAINEHLAYANGVMIGRAAYKNPYFLAEIQNHYGTIKSTRNRLQVIDDFLPYLALQLKNGIKLSAITRHLFGLFHGQPGGANWRRYLSQHAFRKGAGVEVVEAALRAVTEDRG